MNFSGKKGVPRFQIENGGLYSNDATSFKLLDRPIRELKLSA